MQTFVEADAVNHTGYDRTPLKSKKEFVKESSISGQVEEISDG